MGCVAAVGITHLTQEFTPEQSGVFRMQCVPGIVPAVSDCSEKVEFGTAIICTWFVYMHYMCKSV